MKANGLASPGLTVALAMAAGMVAQAVAQHVRLPGILLLLATGVLLGPDVGNLIRPDTLGTALPELVSFAVAVILFEGGMNLDLGRLRRAQRVVRQLVTIGALVSAAGSALVVYLVLGWPVSTSVLFGTVMMVTGPTVVNPLLRRFRVRRRVATVLEAEGILVDAVGAIVSVVALEVALSPSGSTLAMGIVHFVTRLGAGALMGLAGGYLMVRILGIRALVPAGLENTLILALTLALYQGASSLLPESGIATVCAAGIVVGNSHLHVGRELREFKEQLTTLFIGMLFILLAADVRLEEVQALGLPGAAAVALVMFVVRPASVLAGTARSDLTAPERAFIAWMGPRGIVAAAVASIFAVELERHGIAGGGPLRAMVFLLITSSVVIAGLTGGLAARLLDLRRASGTGWIILGASELARALGRALRQAGQDVICLDTSPEHATAAAREGLPVLEANGIDEEVLARVDVSERAGALAVTPNEGVNTIFIERVHALGRGTRLWAALTSTADGVTPPILQDLDARLLFGRAVDVELWSVRIRRATAQMGRFRATKDGAAIAGAPDPGPLPLVLVPRKGPPRPADDQATAREGDLLVALVPTEGGGAAQAWLEEQGWKAEAPPAAE